MLVILLSLYVFLCEPVVANGQDWKGAMQVRIENDTIQFYDIELEQLVYYRITKNAWMHSTYYASNDSSDMVLRIAPRTLYLYKTNPVGRYELTVKDFYTRDKIGY